MARFFRKITRISPFISMSAAAVNVNTTSDEISRISCNNVLNDKHNVGIAEWALTVAQENNDKRVSTLNNLCKYLHDTGYDGVEMGHKHFKRMYFNHDIHDELSDIEIAIQVKHKFDEYNLKVFGVLYHSFDKDWKYDNKDAYLEELKEMLKYDKMLGAKYATFQIFLPDKYMYNDGSYRHDTELLLDFVYRIKTLQDICFELGMNFYVETHIQRLSEDPEAFVTIMDMFEEKYGKIFEINGDLSHYLARGMLNGTYIDKILSRVEHTHVRMCRVYGDLSAEVDDPIKDWNNNGITKQYWNFTKKAFNNGLTSRVIIGESGPWQLVNDALNEDKKILPLLRQMAKYCDEQTRVDTLDKQDYNPFNINDETISLDAQMQ